VPPTHSGRMSERFDLQEFAHVWWWRSKLPERKGQLCRVVVRGRLGSVLVEFQDGWRVVTSRHAVRRASDMVRQDPSDPG